MKKREEEENERSKDEQEKTNGNPEDPEAALLKKKFMEMMLAEEGSEHEKKSHKMITEADSEPGTRHEGEVNDSLKSVEADFQKIIEQELEIPVCNYGPDCKCTPDSKDKETDDTTVATVKDSTNTNCRVLDMTIKIDFNHKRSKFIQLLSMEEEETESFQINNAEGAKTIELKGTQLTEIVTVGTEVEENSSTVVENVDKDKEHFWGGFSGDKETGDIEHCQQKSATTFKFLECEAKEGRKSESEVLTLCKDITTELADVQNALNALKTKREDCNFEPMNEQPTSQYNSIYKKVINDKVYYFNNYEPEEQIEISQRKINETLVLQKEGETEEQHDRLSVTEEEELVEEELERKTDEAPDKQKESLDIIYEIETLQDIESVIDEVVEEESVFKQEVKVILEVIHKEEDPMTNQENHENIQCLQSKENDMDTDVVHSEDFIKPVEKDTYCIVEKEPMDVKETPYEVVQEILEKSNRKRERVQEEESEESVESDEEQPQFNDHPKVVEIIDSNNEVVDDQKLLAIIAEIPSSTVTALRPKSAMARIAERHRQPAIGSQDAGLSTLEQEENTLKDQRQNRPKSANPARRKSGKNKETTLKILEMYIEDNFIETRTNSTEKDLADIVEERSLPSDTTTDDPPSEGPKSFTNMKQNAAKDLNISPLPKRPSSARVRPSPSEERKTRVARPKSSRPRTRSKAGGRTSRNMMALLTEEKEEDRDCLNWRVETPLPPKPYQVPPGPQELSEFRMPGHRDPSAPSLSCSVQHREKSLPLPPIPSSLSTLELEEGVSYTWSRGEVELEREVLAMDEEAWSKWLRSSKPATPLARIQQRAKSALK